MTRTTPPPPPPPCPDEGALHDWLDGRLDAAARDAVARHVDACATCAAESAALRRVRDVARAAPAAILPPDPDALERAIMEAVAARAATAATAGGTPRATPATAAAATPVTTAAPPAEPPGAPPAWSRRPRARRWGTAALLGAVAATAVVTASLTARLVGRGAPAPTVAGAPAVTPAPRTAPPVAPSAASPVTPPVVPAAHIDLDALRLETDHTLAALRAAAAAGDQVLAAETLRVLERALATVDTAIAEAEGALARDPGNAALAELLARTYERKQSLVRRGALLGSRS
jgi:hypothetical protein